jgi:hypothetical protein
MTGAFEFDPWARLKISANLHRPPNAPNPSNRAPLTETRLGELGELGGGSPIDRKIVSPTAEAVHHIPTSVPVDLKELPTSRCPVCGNGLW